MTDKVQNSIWCSPEFSFSVSFGDNNAVSFQEISGLESEIQVAEHRDGNSPTKMPGLEPLHSVTMRKGLFANDSQFWDWYNKIKMSTIDRRAVVISLLDEEGDVKTTWTLNNAWPTKITGADLESEGNEVAVESVEIAYETMIIEAP